MTTVWATRSCVKQFPLRKGPDDADSPTRVDSEGRREDLSRAHQAGVDRQRAIARGDAHVDAAVLGAAATSSAVTARPVRTTPTARTGVQLPCECNVKS